MARRQEAPSYVPAAASLPPGGGTNIDTGDHWPKSRTTNELATERGRKWNDVEAYDVKPSADSGKAAFVPTTAAEHDDEDLKFSPTLVDVPQVASLPAGGPMGRNATPRSRLQARPGAVAVAGVDGPSGDEELGEDCSTSPSSALLIEATVVEDDEPVVASKVAPLPATGTKLRWGFWWEGCW